MSIEVIEVEKFIPTTQTEAEARLQKLTFNSVFHLFLSDDSKRMLPQLLHTSNASLKFL